MSLTNDDYLDLYRTMVTIRNFEETVRKLHLSGKAPGLIHLYSGQEAVATGVCSTLNPADYMASHHRGHGHCIAKGSDPDLLFAELIGRRSGYGMGRSGSMHIYDAKTGNLGTNGIVGGGVSLATGAALSAKIRGSGQVAVSFFGDGVLNQGILFESMNMAAIWSLPVIYICENNRYGEFTESSTVTAGERYADRAAVFGIPTAEVDGMDVIAVYEAAQHAVAQARDGNGPGFLICETYRFTGHHISDRQDYKDDEEMSTWQKRDPIPKLASRLINDQIVTTESIAAVDAEVNQAIDAALERAMLMPELTARELMVHIYAG